MYPTEPTRGVITGIREVTKFKYKVADGIAVTTDSIKVLSHSGTLVNSSMSVFMTKTPRAFIYEIITLSAGDVRISGTVVPVGIVVNVSTYTPPNDDWDQELISNRIMSVQSDAEGQFSIELNTSAGQAVVWCEVPTEFDSTNNAISVDVTYGDNGEYLITSSYQCGIYNDEYDMPTFTISGSCPSDATQIFISDQPNVAAGDSADNNYINALENNVLLSAFPNMGVYSVSFNQRLDERKIVVWCISEAKDGKITVDYMVDFGDIEEVCLAGDTPILLYDGTQKHLRNLTTEDVLMAGDGTPTRITQITRGIISDYHTLYHFDDGTIIDEAHRHRFYNVDAGYWMYLDEWKIGDRAKNYDGTTPKLVSIERVDEPCRRYGLWTESRDYYANNLLSGETAANQTVLANATLEQAVDMMATLDANKLDKLYKGELG